MGWGLRGVGLGLGGRGIVELVVGNGSGKGRCRGG